MYRVEKGKKTDFRCNFVYRARYVNFVILFGHQRKLRKREVMILINDLYMLFSDWEKAMLV